MSCNCGVLMVVNIRGQRSEGTEWLETKEKQQDFKYSPDSPPDTSRPDLKKRLSSVYCCYETLLKWNFHHVRP